MKVRDITFSVNSYDREGDVVEEGIFLHFGDTSVKASNSMDDFKKIVGHFEAIVMEIEESYGDV